MPEEEETIFADNEKSLLIEIRNPVILEFIELMTGTDYRLIAQLEICKILKKNYGVIKDANILTDELEADLDFINQSYDDIKQAYNFIIAKGTDPEVIRKVQEMNEKEEGE